MLKAIALILIVAVSSNADITFYSDDFIESKSHIKNPDEGFYYPVVVEVTPNGISYDKTIPEEQIYHLRCDMSQFSKVVNGDRDKELTQTALDQIDALLARIKSQNKNVVIRFCYDQEYNGHLDQECSMSMIQTHIQQLSQIVNKYYHTITAVEAGMLGPWGEMHTSNMATEDNKAQVFRWWFQNTNDFPVLARTPKAMFHYFGKSIDEMEKEPVKPEEEGYFLGNFNDCFLSSNDDVGTYHIDRTREVNWLTIHNRHLPFGGETCAVHKNSDLGFAIPEIRKLHMSHLNIEYHKDVISKWKNLYYDSSLGDDEIFYGMSGFDYIQRHMGYRLVIRSVQVNYQKGGEFELTMKIDNVGFGNLLKEKMVVIIYTNMNNEIISRKNLGNYKGESELIVRGELLAQDYGAYKVFIKIYGLRENNTDYYYIRFANDNIYNEQINANYIFQVSSNGEIQK